MTSSLAAPRPRAVAIAIALITLFVASTVVALPARADSAGSLSWGVKSSFRSYITSPPAGTVTAGGEATDNGTATSFPQATVTSDSVAYSGSVNFSKPGHGIDITVADPTVRATSATTGVLSGTVNGSVIDIVNLNLASVTPSVSDAVVTFSAVPASFTAAAAAVFTYEEGSAADPVTFSFSALSTEAGDTNVGGGFVVHFDEPEAPAAPSITVSKTDNIEVGDEITITGTGFVPNPPATNGTRPPLRDKFAGAYVILGNFDTTWRPSDSAASSTRRAVVTKWAVAADDVASLGGDAIAIDANGNFSVTITATKGTIDATGNWGIYTYPGSGATYAPFETYTPITWKAGEPATASPTLDWGFKANWRSYITSVPPAGTLTAANGATDSGFVTSFPEAIVSASTVAYSGSVNFSKPGHGIDITLADPTLAVNGVDGVLSATVNGASIPVAILDFTGITGVLASGVVTYTGVPATITGAAGAVFSCPAGTDLDPVTIHFTALTGTNLGGGLTLAPSGTSGPTDPTSPTDPTDPTTPPKPTTPDTATAIGRLTWGIDSDWRNYITGPIASGSIITTGASYSGGQFTFVQKSGNVSLANGTGTANYAGSARFVGHDGALDLTFTSPSVRLTGKTTAVIDISINGSRVAFATLNLAAGSKSTSKGATRYAGVPATLTSAGAVAFQGFYSAGKTLDPVTVTFGAGATLASTGGTTVVAAASTGGDDATIPAQPPATTGLVIDDATLQALLAGEVVTISANGFTPGETVQVVIYSTPTVLGKVTADAAGTATWTGSLPASLSGEHTLVFIGGDTAQGVVLTIPDRATVEGMCLATDANLEWGFKQSFLAYLDSTIANGEWTVDGVEDNAGIFTWTGGTGAIDPDSTVGAVTFTGSVRFTGHDGALDTTIANPVVELSADGAYLLLDVTGVTQGGDDVSATAVRFASLDLDGATATADGDTVTIAGIPATLTAEGAAAFGTYPEGEALDPVTLTATGADGCLAVLAGVAPTEEPSPSASPSPSATPTDDAAPPAEESSSNAWIWWVLGGLVVAAIVAGAIVVRRNNRDTPQA